MPITAFDPLDSKYRSYLRSGSWVLSVGAGMSAGIVPTWSAVTRRVVAAASGQTVTEDQFAAEISRSGWSLDSWLQMAVNEYQMTGRSIDEFNDLLADELYGDLLASAAKHGLRNKVAKLISNPFRRSAEDLLPCYDFFRENYGESTVFKVATALVHLANTGRAPVAVLNFNADVILHTLLTLIQVANEHRKSGTLRPPRFHYRPVHRSTESAGAQIPVFHVHGSIVPKKGGREAREKLVFPESAYAQLAGAMFSWQQSTFLFYAQAYRLVLFGVSMADPNMRRWLAWCQSARLQELEARAGAPVLSSRHVWLTTRPNNALAQRSREFGLLHLGVRTGWLPSWANIGSALENLAG